MTRVSIMQPTYLPWSGYFAMMMQVDHFIFLEDVEFSYQSWQQRNRIKTSDGTLWLTVPVHSSGGSDDLINEVAIASEERWRKTHLHSIKYNYHHAEYYDEVYPLLKGQIDGAQEWLVELTVPLIVDLSDQLNIDCQFHLSSELPSGSGTVDRLIDLCNQFDADEYLAPVGAYDYLMESGKFSESSIKLSFLNYDHPTYPQLHGTFISHLAVVDLLFNTGPAAPDYIREGLSAPAEPDQLTAGAVS